MNSKRIVAAFIALSILAVGSTSFATDLILNNTPVKVLFSPGGGCTQAIIDEINGAKSEVLIQAYSFTSALIAKAILEAHKRGVKVQAIFDKRQKRANYSSATFFANSRMPPFLRGNSGHLYQTTTPCWMLKCNCRRSVITGSFNFTKAAETKNAENLLIIKSANLAKLYVDNWNAHKQHSEVLEPRY